MNRLLRIFSNYYVLILFIFLEAIAGAIIFQGKNYHRSVFVNSVNDLTGNLYSTVTDYETYFSLREENDRLAEEMAEVKARLPESIQEINADYLFVNDTIYKQKYRYRNAHVVKNSVKHKDNYVIIDLGANDGIEPEMGVVTGRSVVGMVVEVSDNYSKVLSFLHSDARVSSKIKRNNAAGILYWTGKNSMEAELQDMPLTTKIFKGDTVVTSGFSAVYPKGIKLGVVKEVQENEAKQLLDVSVELFEDYNTLHHVFVIETLDKEELKSLE